MTNQPSNLDFSFMDKHVDLLNIGQHDYDKGFVLGEFMCWQFPTWQRNHPGCTPIGICKESTNCEGLFFAMVYEDKDGNRYYTHVPGSWEDEVKVFDKGWEACRDARDKWWDEHDK